MSETKTTSTPGANAAIDSILFISFGGPEQPDDIMPFLRNVTAGRDVPDNRLLKVADQYTAIGGRSPINDQTRALIAAVTARLTQAGVDLPVYWGNRNWDPFLTDTMKQMVADGRHHAAGFVTSAYSSYSSCRQYREDIAKAQQGAGDRAPMVNKIGQFYDQRGFIEPFIRNTESVLAKFARPEDVALVFTAHSIPTAMAANSRYESQLLDAAALVAHGLESDNDWSLVYQSRSGSPQTPWLEPDVNDHLRVLKSKGVSDAVIVPVGFISDHVEVMYDLDNQAQETARELDMHVERAATPGIDPQFVAMVGDLISQEVNGVSTNRCLGDTCCSLK